MIYSPNKIIQLFVVMKIIFQTLCTVCAWEVVPRIKISKDEGHLLLVPKGGLLTQFTIILNNFSEWLSLEFRSLVINPNTKYFFGFC